MVVGADSVDGAQSLLFSIHTRTLTHIHSYRVGSKVNSDAGWFVPGKAAAPFTWGVVTHFVEKHCGFG